MTLAVAQIDAIVEEYQSGATVRHVAERHGVSDKAILYHLQRRGIPRRRSKICRPPVPINDRRCTGCGRGVAEGAAFSRRHGVSRERTRARCNQCDNARIRELRRRREAS